MSHVSDTLRVGDAYYAAAGLNQFTSGGDKGIDLQPIVVVEFGAVSALTTTGIVANVTSTGAGAVSATGTLVSGGVATITTPRALSLTSTGNLSGFTITVVGTDSYGAAQTETITGPNATTVYGKKAFKTVTSVTATAATTGGLSVGVSDILGLPYRLADKGKFGGVFVDGVQSTGATVVAGLTTTQVATATNGSTRGTVLATTASNGSALISAWIKVVPTSKETLYGVTPA